MTIRAYEIFAPTANLQVGDIVTVIHGEVTYRVERTAGPIYFFTEASVKVKPKNWRPLHEIKHKTIKKKRSIDPSYIGVIFPFKVNTSPSRRCLYKEKRKLCIQNS